MSHTPGPWRTEAVSDAIRVVAQIRSRDVMTRRPGGIKVILARLAPPQLPEAETAANACLMAAAPELLDACYVVKRYLDGLENAIPENDPLRKARKVYHGPLQEALTKAINKAEGR